MANMDEYRDAAKTPPSERTTKQQNLVSKGSNMQEIRNLDHDARKHERVYGS